jgi:1,2-phenylacetyl-CoA epoxidase catalytic subunit
MNYSLAISLYFPFPIVQWTGIFTFHPFVDAMTMISMIALSPSYYAFLSLFLSLLLILTEF